MFNPQFPHTFRLVCKDVDDNGDVITDDEGNLVTRYKPITAVVMADRQPTFDADGNFVTEEVDSMPFGYRQSSMNTMRSGDVIVSDYKLSCPMFLTELSYGDILELTDYDRTYRVTVVKKFTANLGSLLWVDDIKN